MLRVLESDGVYVSAGSACSKGRESPVLKAMGVDKKRIDSALRISFAPFNTKGDVDALVAALQKGRENAAAGKELINLENAMKEVLLLKCGEIVLKGLNRKTFEDKLVGNIKRRLKHVAPCEVTMRQSVIYVWIGEGSDADAIMDAVKKIFGIALICRAAVCGKTLEAMQETAETYLAGRIAGAKSFKVETKRGDKRFPMTSIQVSQHIGGNLADKYENLRPDMHTPDLTIHLEIRDQHAFVHAGPEPARAACRSAPTVARRCCCRAASIRRSRAI